MAENKKGKPDAKETTGPVGEVNQIVPDSRTTADREEAAKRAAARKEGQTTIKVNLDRTYTYMGTHYGPGVTDLPKGEVYDAITLKQEELQSAGRLSAPNSEINYAEQKARVERLSEGQENPNAADSIVSRGGAKSKDPAASGRTVTSVLAHPANPEGKSPGGASDPEHGNVDKDGGEQQDLDDEAAERFEKEQSEGDEDTESEADDVTGKTSKADKGGQSGSAGRSDKEGNKVTSTRKSGRGR